MMDQFANPHLQMAVKRLDKINSELLSENKNFIDLQAKLIEKRDEELRTTQTELDKSFIVIFLDAYAAAVSYQQLFLYSRENLAHFVLHLLPRRLF